VVLRSAARDIYRRLMDSVDPELVEQARSVLAGSPGVGSVAWVRLRWVGHQLLAEADIVADGALSLTAAHAVAEEAHHRLLHEIPRLSQATIHVDPAEVDGSDHHQVIAHHFPEAAPDGEPPAGGGSPGAGPDVQSGRGPG
jgi:divalent metal cation (Fe/Co/Zn/Cd) transporter